MQKRIVRYWPVIWLVILGLYMLAGTTLTPFHGDESTQIFMSRDYADQFMQRDLSAIAYRDPPRVSTEQELRLLNGTLNKYLIGLAWHSGGFGVADLNEQWDWGAGWDYNQQNGHMPSAALLQAARWPSSLLMAAGVVVVFVLGWVAGGPLTAYLASLYYALCPPLLVNGHRAMMEGSLTFFSLLTVLCGVWFARQGTWWAAAVLGVAAGLAVASKHSAVFAVVGVLVGVILNHKSTKDTKQFLKLFFSGFVAFIVFYAVNPAWWGDPFTRAGQVLTLRQELLTLQSEVFGGYADPLDALAGFGRQVLVALPQYYEVSGWEGFISEQIAAYEASPWRGVSIGGTMLGALVLGVMLVMGAWGLLRRLCDSAVGVVGGWVLAVVLSTLLLTPLEWQRYYVPAYPAVGLLAAVGATQLWRWLRRSDKGFNLKDTKITKELSA
jgi:4-amino-4-deoxy-L-arabinose transferase-like glycosyltransferase